MYVKKSKIKEFYVRKRRAYLLKSCNNFSHELPQLHHKSVQNKDKTSRHPSRHMITAFMRYLSTPRLTRGILFTLFVYCIQYSLSIKISTYKIWAKIYTYEYIKHERTFLLNIKKIPQREGKCVQIK